MIERLTSVEELKNIPIGSIERGDGTVGVCLNDREINSFCHVYINTIAVNYCIPEVLPAVPDGADDPEPVKCLSLYCDTNVELTECDTLIQIPLDNIENILTDIAGAIIIYLNGSETIFVVNFNNR